MKKLALLIILSILAPVTVQAQPAGDPQAPFNKCRRIPDVAERAACYDAITDQQATGTGANSPRYPELTRSGQPDLSYAIPERRRLPEPAENEELVSRVATLEKTQNGWLVTLENGQIWKQIVGKAYHMRDGQEVRIYPSRWGDNYRLSATGSGGFIQVRRIR